MIKPFSGDFPITQNFNDPRYRANYLKFGILGHNGIDYGTPTGTPIIAPHAGKILEATLDPEGYGNYVKIESDVEGSVLGHLKSFSVGIGNVVSEGQQIGLSDNTGNSTGPHLHWGYYRVSRNRDNGFNGYIDQTDWLNLKLPEVKITDQTKINLGEAGIMEVQAIRSEILDARRDLAQMRSDIATLSGKQLESDKKIKDLTESLTASQDALQKVVDQQMISVLGKLFYSLAKAFG